MGMKKRWKAAILSLDGKIASRFLSAAREEGSLLCFLFHGLFESGEELRSGVLDPQQGITVEMFRAFLGHFHEQGYGFVSPRQILEGPQPGGRHILLTFDDGYFNNVRALPMMEEFNAPAVFFVSSDHVREGKAFWWDAAFRQGRKHRKTEKTPEMISYPNGNSSPQIEQAAREAGLQLGVLVRRGKNRLPLKIGAPEAMSLKRFILWGDCGIDVQCLVSRANISFYRLLESLKVRASVALR